MGQTERQWVVALEEGLKTFFKIFFYVDVLIVCLNTILHGCDYR